MGNASSAPQTTGSVTWLKPGQAQFYGGFTVDKGEAPGDGYFGPFWGYYTGAVNTGPYTTVRVHYGNFENFYNDPEWKVSGVFATWGGQPTWRHVTHIIVRVTYPALCSPGNLKYKNVSEYTYENGINTNTRVRKTKTTITDDVYYLGAKTCPGNHNWKVTETQTYLNTATPNGKDYFVKYNADGSKQYCKEQNIDRGWRPKLPVPSNDPDGKKLIKLKDKWPDLNKRDQYTECVNYNKPIPAVHASLQDYATPRVSNGASPLILTKGQYTAEDLGGWAGQITQIRVPNNFAIRMFKGTRFDGHSADYYNDMDVGDAGKLYLSLRVTPMYPVIFSAADNFMGNKKMAFLLNTLYTRDDLDNGVFSTKEANVRASITGLWVPPGFAVKITHAGGVQEIYGHNTDGPVAVAVMPTRIDVRVVMPVTHSLTGYKGVITLLTAGTNIQSSTTRKAMSLSIPRGYTVVGTTPFSGTADKTFNANVPNMTTQYPALIVNVLYTEKPSANMIDNLPVRVDTVNSKTDYYKECKQECDANYDCKAYYALRVVRECPNPEANDGEDPTANGCKYICGYYEGQNANMATAEYRSIQPQLYDGKLSIKNATI